MDRGEIWWADFPAPVGQRPVVLLTRATAIRARQQVTVAVITRTIRNIPSEVPLGASEGMPKPCVVNADTLQTIPKDRLINPITSLPPTRMAEVSRAVRFALALDS